MLFFRIDSLWSDASNGIYKLFPGPEEISSPISSVAGSWVHLHGDRGHTCDRKTKLCPQSGCSGIVHSFRTCSQPAQTWYRKNVGEILMFCVSGNSKVDCILVGRLYHMQPLCLPTKNPFTTCIISRPLQQALRFLVLPGSINKTCCSFSDGFYHC